MFNLYKYKLKHILHTKLLLGWCFLFPLALGTLFYFAFSGLIYSEQMIFQTIPIAIVIEEENKTLHTVMEEIANSKDTPLFEFVITSKEEGIALLEDNKIDGILFEKKVPYVMVNEKGINQSILTSFLKKYNSRIYLLETIAMSQPQNLSSAIKALQEELIFVQDIALTSSQVNGVVQYFYSLIAMTCLYASMAGCFMVLDMQANLSPLGMRREASPTHKFKVILMDFAATVSIQFIGILSLLAYLIFILKIDFGNQLPLVIVTSFIGTLIGVSSGIFVGSLGKFSFNFKMGILMAFSMICSFLSGLMVNNMKHLVEKAFPIINKINPAALIVDCFYTLSVYDTYERYITNIIIMLIMTSALCVVSYFILRRNKYASL